MTVQSLAVGQEFCASAGEFRRLVQQGGVYLNDERVEDASRIVTAEDLLDGAFIVLRRCRKNHHLVRVVS
jgi:tyrosyl-tRNA synthetase